jgi:hypothetical protein
VLAADGLNDVVLDGIVTELGQRPPAIGEADNRGRLVGELAESRPLVSGETRRRPAPAAVPHPVQALAVEGMEVGLDRVRVEGKEACHRGGVPALGVEHDGFDAAQLLTVSSRLQELSQLAEFSKGRLADGQGAGHDENLPGREPAVHCTKGYVTNSHISYVTRRLRQTLANAACSRADCPKNRFAA